MEYVNNNVKLEVLNRSLGTKKDVNCLRSSGRIPCVIYGDQYSKSTSFIHLCEMDAERIVNSPVRTSTIFALTWDDGRVVQCILRQFQIDNVSRRVLHLDFQPIYPGHVVTLYVRIKLLNESLCVGVKKGGILIRTCDFLLVSCYPEHIPPYIGIDVSDLKIGHSIHSNDMVNLNYPGVKIINIANQTLVRVSGKKDKE